MRAAPRRLRSRNRSGLSGSGLWGADLELETPLTLCPLLLSPLTAHILGLASWLGRSRARPGGLQSAHSFIHSTGTHHTLLQMYNFATHRRENNKGTALGGYQGGPSERWEWKNVSAEGNSTGKGPEVGNSLAHLKQEGETSDSVATMALRAGPSIFSQRPLLEAGKDISRQDSQLPG